MYKNKTMVREEFQDMFTEDETVLCTRSTQYLKKWVATCNKSMRKNTPGDRKDTAGGTLRDVQGIGKHTAAVPVTQTARTVKPYSKVHMDWVDRRQRDMVACGHVPSRDE